MYASQYPHYVVSILTNKACFEQFNAKTYNALNLKPKNYRSASLSSKNCIRYSYQSIFTMSSQAFEISFKWNILNMKLILITLPFQLCIIHRAKGMTLMRNYSLNSKKKKSCAKNHKCNFDK